MTTHAPHPHPHYAIVRRLAALAVVFLVVVGFGIASVAASSPAATAPVGPTSTPHPTVQATTQWLAASHR